MAASALATTYPNFSVQSVRDGDARFVVQSQTAQFDGSRYKINIATPAPFFDDFKAAVTAFPTVNVTLISEKPADTPAVASISFLATAGEATLVMAAPHPSMTFGATKLEFLGSLKPQLVIDGKAAVGVLRRSEEHRYS